MADYTAQAITLDGIEPTARTAASGDKLIDPGDRKFLLVHNGGESSITATLVVPGNTAYGVALPDKPVTVDAGDTKAIPVLAAYADPSDSNKAAVTWSATTDVTFNYLRI